MKRSGFLKRSDGKARMDVAIKPKRCPKTKGGCGEPFIPRRPLQAACGNDCAAAMAAVKRLKAERREDKARREKLKTRSDWMREAQAAVNRYCRLRDQASGIGCYTCGATPAAAFGGTLDAGHFRSVGSAPHLRYWTSQIKAQCVPCNRHKGGMALAFRRALVAERGAEWVEALEAMQGSAKFTVDYLKRLKRVFTKKANRQEKRNAVLCE